MITYHYRCTDEKCEYDFEIKQTMRDSALTHCPHCEQKTLKKLINNQGGFRLKGSGWARDGYR